MPTRPSLLGGPLSGEIDLRPPEQPEFGVGVLDMAALANPLTLVPVLGARAALDEDFRDVGAAAFRNENIVGSMLTMPRLSNAVDPEFDLMKRVEEEGELRSFDYFMTARNEDDFRLKLERLRKERDDRRVLAESGMAGAEMSLFAGILDLPTLIPGAAISRTAGGGLNALNVGASAAGAAGAAEAVLQSNQAERTAAESLFAVGGSFILGAGIGAGVGRAVPKPLFDTVAKQIENLPTELDRVGRVMAGAEDAPPPKAAGGKVIAFHGTGSSFDKFSMDFVGTGEGDAAFGYGLYFAERPETAKSYFDKLATGRNLQGNIYRVEIPETARILDWEARISEQPEAVKARIGALLESMGATPEKVFDDIYSAPDADALARSVGEELNGEPTGMDVYDWVAMNLSDNRRDGLRLASEAFRDAGIPGLRYLDKGSRGDKGSTRNFVVFDDAEVRIVADGEAPPPRGLSADVAEDAPIDTSTPFDIRNEGIFRFMRKFPGGYLADIAEQFGKPGLAVVLEKAAPLAPFTRMEVLARSQLQSDPVGRRITADLMESVWQYRINEEGGVISPGGSVESRVKYRTHALLNENLWAIKKAYSSHVADGPVGVLGTLVAPLTGRYARLQGAEKLTAQQFMREVGIAMFSGDTHPVKAVRDLAAQLRGKVFEPLRKDMVDVGLFDDLPFKPKYGESYMTRRYRIDKIRQNERAVVARLVDEFQANQVAARQRLRDAEVKGEPVVGSDEYVANMTLDEIHDSVRKTLNSIKGLNLGDSFLSVMNSSPLHARVLDVPDHVLLDLGILETDIGVLTESYIKSVVPRIEMQRKFGNLTLEPQLKEMSESYSLRREGLSAPRAKQLESEELARRQDLIGARDRILGVYDMPANPDDIWSRATKQVRNLSYMQLLGMQVISAAPDVSGLIRRAGLREFAGGVLDMATKMPTFVKNSREAAELLNAIEVVGNTRARNLAELDARYMNLTPAERLVEGATGVFSHATGMTAWNMTWKSVANVMVMSRILKAADALVKGKATKAQKIALSENLIDEKLARRMVDQFEKHGEKGNGLWYARAGKWDDADAYNAGQMAMSRETDIAVITPGQDKPLFFSSRVGAFFMQFKSFGVSANHRIVLSGLQQHDASVLMQFAALFAMGAVVSNLRADLSGRPRKEGDALLIDAIDRAGPFQIAFEANAVAEIGGVGLAGLTGSELPSRFQGRSKILGALGPNVDMGAIFLQTLLAARSEKGLSPRDVDKVARLLPFQNTPYGMLFRNDIREGIAGMFGAEYEP